MKNQKGFVHLILIIAVVVIGLGAITYSAYKNSKVKNQTQVNPEITVSPENQNGQGAENNITTIPSPAPKTTTSPKVTAKPTQKPTTTPTKSSTSGSSCNYNTSAGTGAVKVNIQAQTGILVGDSSVPAGSYSIRAQYKGQWTGYQAISVNSGQLTTTTITVSGDTPTNPPTPSPKPKPRCLSPVIYPSSTGVAPFNALLQPQGYADLAGGIAGYEWDFIGDGSWDTSASPNAQYYTYQPAGTYTVKMRVLATNGEYSDTCQSTVTVN
ncbi:MAG: hypothetical protein UT08_C0018G0025 [Candidatus Woesebacteria bacterium GW2011_GWB1_38_8]|uniref:PKD domain-containing protein n=1 Tax=Candidatus Woesebacteria bacterium GW2011_GWB1_38_8 TaxID=1618570 RepID=A0A0G0NET4_9BACT|nr:MAG: hypothetical protein UT08_C0018G0025 [Candidatus Woesebacteria bacterium GW2011_GWB1_38_8]